MNDTAMFSVSDVLKIIRNKDGEYDDLIDPGVIYEACFERIKSETAYFGSMGRYALKLIEVADSLMNE